MIVQNVFHVNESYTHENWVYKDISVGFSRIYYIIDGEAYYEEGGKKVRLKKGYLYLTPVNVSCTLYDNPDDRLLHTYSHINTIPAITELVELKVEEGSLLSDAVALWRKHIHTDNFESLIPVVQMILSCMGKGASFADSVAERAKAYIDGMKSFSFSTKDLSHALGYSREHISRSFCRAYGLTLKEYFNKRRMNVSVELLAGKYNLYEIASIIGYSSGYAFSKAFKNHFGISPEKYRKMFSERDF